VKRLRLDSAARAELLHETRYYESVRSETGRKFRLAVDDAFGGIKTNPKCGKPDEESCRRVRIKGFPLSVVFREETAEIVVYAIRADAREPGYWLARTR
jgi:plasmid stabilization system protein ParE